MTLWWIGDIVLLVVVVPIVVYLLRGVLSAAESIVPTVDEMIDKEDKSGKEKVEVPLIIVSDETDYLVFFDTTERLFDWAEKEVPFLQLPGHVLAEMTTDELHWAMNIGTDYNKQFAPDEIAWLKDVVERCKVEENQTSQ